MREPGLAQRPARGSRGENRKLTSLRLPGRLKSPSENRSPRRARDRHAREPQFYTVSYRPSRLLEAQNRCLQTTRIGHVGTDRDCLVAREVSGLVDLGNGDFCPFSGEQDRCGAADPATGARDESHFACEPWHRFFLLDRKFENSPKPSVHMNCLNRRTASARERLNKGL